VPDAKPPDGAHRAALVGQRPRPAPGGNRFAGTARFLVLPAQLQVVRRSFVVPGSSGAQQCSLFCPEASYLRSQCPNLVLERTAAGTGPRRVGHAPITGTGRTGCIVRIGRTGCIVRTGRTGCIVRTGRTGCIVRIGRAGARLTHRRTGPMSL